MSCTVRSTARSHCCWLCEYALATQNMCVSHSHSLSLSSNFSPPHLSLPVCNFQRNYGNSNQVARQLAVGERHEAWGMQHAQMGTGIAIGIGIGKQPTSWRGWQARAIESISRRVRVASNVFVCVCCWCVLLACVLLVLSAQMFV